MAEVLRWVASTVLCALLLIVSLAGGIMPLFLVSLVMFSVSLAETVDAAFGMEKWR